MKRNFRIFQITLGIFLFAGLLVMPVLAQDKLCSEPGAVSLNIGGKRRPITADEWGTKDYTYYWLPASAFIQKGISSLTFDALGYIYRTGGATMFWAPVNLPNGVDIYAVRLYFYDNSASDDITMWLTRYRTDTNLVEDLDSISTSGTPGYSNTGFDPHPNSIIDNEHQYVINLYVPTSDDTLMFKGVRLEYKRRISPVPGTATFPDVATSHPFFQHIEALAASGITTGYADGTFRPSDYVTRQALAAFLARALGLHWPY